MNRNGATAFPLLQQQPPCHQQKPRMPSSRSNSVTARRNWKPSSTPPAPTPSVPSRSFRPLSPPSATRVADLEDPLRRATLASCSPGSRPTCAILLVRKTTKRRQGRRPEGGRPADPDQSREDFESDNHSRLAEDGPYAGGDHRPGDRQAGRGRSVGGVQTEKRRWTRCVGTRATTARTAFTSRRPLRSNGLIELETVRGQTIEELA